MAERNFTPYHKLSHPFGSNGTVSSGSSDSNGTAIDMRGYFAVTFMVQMGSISSSAVTSLKLQQSNATGSGWVDVPDAEVDIEADDDNGIFLIEFEAPTARYVRLVLDRSTANAAVSASLAIRATSRKTPVAYASADAVKSVTLVNGFN